MKISVITPTFNSEKTISENVNSVLSQSYREFEHIIIDNCSNDSTLEIISELYNKNNCTDKLIIISEKDEGISDAFNKGIKNASGDIITILNGDDKYFHNQVFADVVKSLIQQEILFVHGNILFQDEKYGSNLRRPLLCDVRVAMPFNHPTMFFKKEIFDKVGYFNTSYRYSMDFEFICRISKVFELPKISFYLNSQPMVIMNAGGASWNNEIESIKETKRALKTHKLWNIKSFLYYSFRVFRTYLKKLFSHFGLEFVVNIWRNHKWSS
jgi:glycosyltransferase